MNTIPGLADGCGQMRSEKNPETENIPEPDISLPPRSAAPFRSLPEAAAILRRSGIIVYPTETFFAIGGLACNEQAVVRVYAAKKRPASSPLPVLAADLEQVEQIADIRYAPEALQKFWPGPLTVLLPARSCLPDALVNADGKTAVRISPHPLARALALAAGGPLSASSANLSGHSAIAEIARLEPELFSVVDGVLAGCPVTAGGQASTLVEPCSPSLLRIVRPGAVSESQLREAGYQFM